MKTDAPKVLAEHKGLRPSGAPRKRARAHPVTERSDSRALVAGETSGSLRSTLGGDVYAIWGIRGR